MHMLAHAVKHQQKVKLVAKAKIQVQNIARLVLAGLTMGMVMGTTRARTDCVGVGGSDYGYGYGYD